VPQPEIDIARKVIDNVDAMMGYWDRDLRCRFVNAAYQVWFGRSREEILHRSKQELMGPIFDADLPHIQAALNGEVQVFERDITLPDGSIRHTLTAYYPDIVDGVVQGFSVQVTDVSRMKRLEIELQNAKRQAEMLATHDFLTGLPNRVLLMDRISAATTHAERAGGVVGVIAIDVDGFKDVNDSYGHEVGDCVLKKIAVRMKEAIRATDTVTRLGGDEFIFLATEAEGVAGLESAIIRLQRAVHQPLECLGITLSPSISCGIAVFPAQGAGATELLLSADAALYKAKRQGKGCFVFAG
jgi:diguanylate cyclase (GGDEF)-like protein/PAS domain S-box-containing protein